MEHSPHVTFNIQQVAERFMALLKSKHALIARVQSGKGEDVLRYVASAQGIALSDSLRDELRLLEDGLDHDVQRLVEHKARTSQLALWALLAAVGGGIALGLIGAKLLAGSITGPLASLHAAVTTLGTQAEWDALLQGMAIHSSDEIGPKEPNRGSHAAIPLLSQGIPFGVLILLTERDIPCEFWNVGLAKGFADEAAVAIANARLYQAAQENGKGLQSRLRQLEHLAEMLAHDLKGQNTWKALPPCCETPMETDLTAERCAGSD